MQATRLTFFDISPAQQIEIDSLISGSFFASYNFMFLWRYMSGKAVYWIVEENNEIVAVLPAVEFGVGKLKRMQALPDGCYSSIFAKENDQAGRYKNELLKAVLSYGYQKIFIYDFDNSISEAEGYDISECQTTFIDVSSPNWLPPDRTLKLAIKKAKRENLSIEKFDKNKHFSKFIELMNHTEKRHNRKPRYSEQFYEALTKVAETDNRIIWSWCEHESKAVSSHVSFVEKNQIIDWQMCYDKQFSSLKSNQKIVFELAMIARKNNIQYLNLGGSPIETPTLIEYKKRWGGSIKKFSCYYHKTLLGKIF